MPGAISRTMISFIETTNVIDITKHVGVPGVKTMSLNGGLAISSQRNIHYFVCPSLGNCNISTNPFTLGMNPEETFISQAALRFFLRS